MLRIVLALMLGCASVAFAGSQNKPASPITSPRSLPRVASRAEFDRLARVYYQGRFYALPHLMFIIDRSANADSDKRIYYVNSKRYSFHTEFVGANYLTLERGREFFKHNYLDANRRFILGTIAYQTKLGKFTFEFWEGDLATAQILREAHQTISKSFFAPVAFKPNSGKQEEASAQAADVPRLPAAQVNPPQDYCRSIKPKPSACCASLII